MKRFKLQMSIILSFLFVVASIAVAQEARIIIEAWSPQEIHDLGWSSPRSNGLKVVGVDEMVYLFAVEAGGEALTAVNWTLSSQPDGSTTALDSTDKQRATFSPDTEGQYNVDVVITTATGTSNSSVTITASMYVGVGTIAGATPDTPKGQCGTCHAGNEATWSATGHATMFTEAIDGLKSAGYNANCIQCHTVGYLDGANNGGFADVATDLDWTFPETLESGNWQDIVDNYPALAAVSNIQCESCHGPGSQHRGDVSKIDISLDEGLCGSCHEEAPYHRKNTMWKNSGHAIGVALAAGRSGCADCHSSYGFIARIDPASDLEQKTGFQQIACAACHDPHSGDAGEHQIRDQDDVELGNGTIIKKGGKGKLCMNCHIGRRDAIVYAQKVQGHFGPHHSNQADMLFGQNVITWGMIVPNSTHKDALENTCVDCHMFETPGTGEPGSDLVGDHSFAMSAEENGAEVENVAACARCHGNITEYNDIIVTEDYDGDGAIEGYQDELDGQLEKVALLLPPIGDPAVQDDPDDTYSRIQLNALFNYHYIHDDASHGAHNFRFAVGLMQLTEAALTYGVLTEGDILTISDIPNDQGKQVRISWSRFGGDGVSDNPVRNYAIWRKVEGGKAAGKALNSLNISSTEINKLENGAKLAVQGGLWDFVGSVPASMENEYSAVVPTLFDAVPGDTVLSTFRVSGHTNVTAIYAVTQPDSGYSVDNLFPAAPENLSGQLTNEGVALYWTNSVDEDFKYFAVYRAITEAELADAEPLAEVTENTYLDQSAENGKNYFYRVTAFDFSGNQSDASPAISFNVTSVLVSEQIPTSYALEQNFPNPFNPSTTIRFQVKEQGHVKLIMFNAAGKEVMTVVDEKLIAGTHHVKVNAQNLPSGVYFYKMSVNNFSKIKKMLFIK